MPVFVGFNVNNANFLADNALLFNGQNQVFSWHAHLKQVNPIYSSGVLNPHAANINILIDHEALDFLVFDPDVTIGNLYDAP